MWNNNKSILLSRLCVIAFIVLLTAVAVLAPFLVERLIANRIYLVGAKTFFLLTIYTGCVPAAVLLASLFLLLHRIKEGRVLVTKNVESLRHISWCCFLGALICLASALYYIPWLAVAVAAAFMGLIVRVIKNVFDRAVSLQNDADFTI